MRNTREEAWHMIYNCLHWGDPKAKVMEIDQEKIIVMVEKLIVQHDKNCLCGREYHVTKHCSICDRDE